MIDTFVAIFSFVPPVFTNLVRASADFTLDFPFSDFTSNQHRSANEHKATTTSLLFTPSPPTLISATSIPQLSEKERKSNQKRPKLHTKRGQSCPFYFS
jgi:hypothetical protein